MVGETSGVCSRTGFVYRFWQIVYAIPTIITFVIYVLYIHTIDEYIHSKFAMCATRLRYPQWIIYVSFTYLYNVYTMHA